MQLEPDQEFKIYELKENVKSMSEAEIKQRLTEVYRSNILLDNKYKPLIQKAWGL
jgi:hypothetical protein